MSSFSTLLRHSKFMHLGNFENRLMIGKVIHRVGGDLYVDVGLKFNAVCKPPSKTKEICPIGSNVLVKLHDPELSQRFLGSRYDLSLLEADATILARMPNNYQLRPQLKAPMKNVEQNSAT